MLRETEGDGTTCRSVEQNRWPATLNHLNHFLVGMTKSIASARADPRPLRAAPFEQRMTAGGAATMISEDKDLCFQLCTPIPHPLFFTLGGNIPWD